MRRWEQKQCEWVCDCIHHHLRRDSKTNSRSCNNQTSIQDGPGNWKMTMPSANTWNYSGTIWDSFFSLVASLHAVTAHVPTLLCSHRDYCNSSLIPSALALPCSIRMATQVSLLTCALSQKHSFPCWEYFSDFQLTQNKIQILGMTRKTLCPLDPAWLAQYAPCPPPSQM